MKYYKLIFTLLIIFTIQFCFSQAVTDCKILKHSKLRYRDSDDKTAYVMINDTKHVEYLECFNIL